MNKLSFPRLAFFLLAIIGLSSCEDELTGAGRDPEVITPSGPTGKMYFMEFDLVSQNPFETEVTKAYPDGTRFQLAYPAYMFGTPQKNAIIWTDLSTITTSLYDSNGVPILGPLGIPADASINISADGTKIAYGVPNNTTGTGDLYLMDIGPGVGNPVTQLVSTQFYIESTPVFSPDSKSLAFYTQVMLGPETIDGFAVASDFEGGLRGGTGFSMKYASINEDFFHLGTQLDQISWNTPSSDVLFHTDMFVYKFTPSIEAVQQIGEGIHGVFSPDDSKIMYVSIYQGNTDLVMTDRSGSAPERITYSSNLYEVFPQWSPDGNYILFTELDTDPSTDDVFSYVALKWIKIDDPTVQQVISNRALRGFWLAD